MIDEFRASTRHRPNSEVVQRHWGLDTNLAGERWESPTEHSVAAWVVTDRPAFGQCAPGCEQDDPLSDSSVPTGPDPCRRSPTDQRSRQDWNGSRGLARPSTKRLHRGLAAMVCHSR